MCAPIINTNSTNSEPYVIEKMYNPLATCVDRPNGPVSPKYSVLSLGASGLTTTVAGLSQRSHASILEIRIPGRGPMSITSSCSVLITKLSFL